MLTLGSIRAAFDQVQSGDTIQVYGMHVISPGVGGGELAPSHAALQLTGKSGITVEGFGDAVVYGAGPGDFLSVESCENITIRRLTFEGNRPPVSGGDGGLFAMILLRGNNEDITVSRCRFLRFGNHGVSHLWGAKTSRRVSVSDCHFEGGGAVDVPALGFDGAAVSGIGSQWTLDRNRVVDCVRGFELENPSPTLIEGVTIVNNSFTGLKDLGVMLFASNGGGDRFTDILISGNTFKDFLDATGSATAIRFSGGARVHVQNNVIRNMARQGIVFTSTDGDISGLNISGNTVDAVGNNGIVLARGDKGLSSAIVNGNAVSRCGGSGIRIVGARDVVVNGNLCFNNGILSLAGGIDVLGREAYGVMVTANRCLDNSADMTQDFGIWVGLGASSTLVQGNYSPDAQAAAAGILVEGSTTLLDANTTFIEPAPPDPQELATRPPVVSTPVAISATSTSVTLSWDSVPGRTYVVEYKPSLSTPGWVRLMAATEADSARMTFSHPAQDGGERYYRVVRLD